MLKNRFVQQIRLRVREGGVSLHQVRQKVRVAEGEMRQKVRVAEREMRQKVRVAEREMRQKVRAAEREMRQKVRVAEREMRQQRLSGNARIRGDVKPEIYVSQTVGIHSVR